MRRVWRLWLTVLAVLAGGVSALAQAPAPNISSLSPSSIVDGSSSFTMTLTGTNFPGFPTANDGVCFYTGFNIGKPIAPSAFGATTATITVPATALSSVPASSFSGGTFTADVFIASLAANCSTSSHISNIVTFTINQVAETITSPSPAQIGEPQGAFTLQLSSTSFPPLIIRTNGICFYTGFGSTTPIIPTSVTGGVATVAIPATATSSIPAASYTNGIFNAQIFIAPTTSTCSPTIAESNVANFAVVDVNLSNPNPSAGFAGAQTATPLQFTGGNFPAFSSSTLGVCFYAQGSPSLTPLIPTVSGGTATLSVPASYIQNIPTADFGEGGAFVAIFVAPATQNCNPNVTYSDTVNYEVSLYTFEIDSSNNIPAGQAGFPLQIDPGSGALPTFSASTYGLCFFTPYGTTIPLIPTTINGFSSVTVPASYVQSLTPANYAANFGEISTEIFVAQAGQTCNDANAYSQINYVYLEEPESSNFSFSALSQNNPALSASANPTQIQVQGFDFATNPVAQAQVTYIIGNATQPEVTGTTTYVDIGNVTATLPPPVSGATSVAVNVCNVATYTYCGGFLDPTVYPLAVSTSTLTATPSSLYTTQTTSLAASYVPGTYSTPTKGAEGALSGTVTFTQGSSTLGTAPLVLNTATATFAAGDATGINNGAGSEASLSNLSFNYADFNKDGIPDLVILDATTNSFHLMLGTPPRGDYLQMTDLPTGGCDGTILAGAVGDVNNDGYPDLVYICRPPVGTFVPPSTIYVALNQGGIITGTPTAITTTTATQIAIGDVNKDGNADIVISGVIGTNPANGAAIYGFATYLGNGSGTTFTTGPTTTSVYGQNGTQLTLVDYDQDGYPDIAVTNTVTPIGVVLLRNDHTGVFGATTATVTTSSATVKFVIQPLSTSTKYPSVLVTDAANTRVGISVNPGTGAFTAPALTYTTLTAMTSTSWGDFNGDGNLDVAFYDGVNFSTADIAVRLGNGTGTLAAGNTIVSGYVPNATILPQGIDQNGDGYADVLSYVAPAYSGSSGNLTNYMVTGTTTATLNNVSLPAGSPTVVTATTPGTVEMLGGSPTTNVTVTGPPAPTITWANPAAITYGTLLSATQLNATASYGGVAVTGTFTYTPAAGTLLTAGTQTLMVLFTPMDTIDYSSATKSVTIVVNQATPTVSWTTPAPIAYGTALSATQLDATATGISGSLPGNFVYTPASGAILNPGTQTLNVTFTPTDTTDYKNGTGSTTILVNAPPSAYTAPTTPVASTSATQTAYVNFTTAGQAGSINVLTQGAANLDYKLVSGGTCAVGTTYAVNAVCSVLYSFTPSTPGERLGGITLTLNNAAGAVLGGSYLSGIGTGPLVTFPGDVTPVVLNSSFTQASGLAEDGSGNIFVSDDSASAVKELTAASGYATSTTVGSGFLAPRAVAVDGFGNLFVADSSTGKVSEVTAAGGYTTVTSVGTGLAQPEGVALDGSGNLYVSDAKNNNVKRFTAASGYTTVATLGSGFSKPVGIAVDAGANVFVADNGNNAVKEITAASGYTTVNTLGSGITAPVGVAVDPAGDVFVTSASLQEILAVGGYTTVNTLLPATAVNGIASDPKGNLIFDVPTKVEKLPLATPASLTFPSTQIATTSATLNTTVANEGNAILAFTALASTNAANFPLGGSTCSGTGTLATGANCTIGVAFSPQSTGTLTGNANATDNTLNVPGTVQSIALSGLGVLGTKTITFPQPTTPVALGATATLTATASNGDPVTYSITGGTATLSGSGITYTNAGTVTITANSAATSTYAAATPLSVMVTVQKGTPIITWNPNPSIITSGTALSSAQLDATAAYNGTNVPGIFTYTPTGGTVLGPGPQTLSVSFAPTDATDYNTATGTASIIVSAATAYTAPTTPVGTTSATQTVTLSFSTAGTLGSINVLTQGAPNLDYKLVPGGTCATGTIYNVGDTCALSFSFTPSVPGTRLGGITLTTATGTLLGSSYLNGIGTGPQATFPGNTAAYTLNNSFSEAAALAQDGTGNLFVVDGTAGVVKELTAASGYATAVLVKSGLSTPSAAAVDGFGNLFVSNLTGRVDELLAAGGYATTVTVGPAADGVANAGVAVDGSGNLYVSRYGGTGPGALGSIQKYTAASGYSTASAASLGSGFNTPQGLAVDANANVFVADYGNNAVKEITAASGYTTVTTLGSNTPQPRSISLDAAGNVFVAAEFQIDEILAMGGYTTVNTLAPSSFAVEFLVDGHGNVFGADNGANVFELNLSTPATLTFPSTQVGSTSAVQSETLANDGNAALNFTSLVSSSTANFPLSGSTCTGSGSVAAGASCTIGVEFTPQTAGPLYGSATATDNNLNVTGSMQSISVTGNGALGTKTITFPQPTTPVALGATATLTATTSNGDPVTYSITAGTASLSGSTVTFSNAGSVTITANSAATSTYAAAATVSRSVTVQVGLPVVSWTTPAAITYGTALSATQLDATASYNGSPVAGTFVYTPAAGAIPSAGTDTLSVQFTPTDITDYATPAAKTVQLVVNKATPTVTWATPSPITYGTQLSATQLDATASVPGTFVYTPAAGAIPTAGTDTLSVQFTPTDTTDYATPAAQTVQLVVNKAAPTVTWSMPAPITVGTALSAAQLDATATGVTGASLPGTFTYSPASGTVLGVGTQPLSVQFAPTDATDYTSGSASTSIVVESTTNTAPTTPVGSTSATQTVYITFTTSGTLGAINYLTQGAPNLDFHDPSGGSCQIGLAYTAGSVCSVNYFFSPTAPGLRLGAITLTSGSSLLGTALISGIGTGPLATVTPGVISTVAGNGTDGYVASQDTGTTLATNAEVSQVVGVALDGAGNLYIADASNNRVRMVSAASGDISTVAGNGATGYTASQDGGPAISASVSSPFSVAVDGAGNLYIADSENNRIRKVTAATGIISTVAGNGITCTTSESATSGCFDGGAATSGELNDPSGVAVDGAGNLYIADSGTNRIRKVTAATGIISTVAGNGTGGYVASQDRGTTAATSAEINAPYDVSLDAAGNLYIADSLNQRIRKVAAATGFISTVAGNGQEGYDASQDTGTTLATNAELSQPTGIRVDSAGDLYIADDFNYRIRKVTAATGTISTVAGSGTYCAVPGCFDGGPATAGQITNAQGIGLDGAGNLYIGDTNGYRVRKVTATGAPLTFASQSLGTTSAAQSSLLNNAGNTALTLSALAASNANFTLSGSTCTATGTLSAGASCSIGVAFTPQSSGTLTGNANATDNSLNVAGTTQSIALSGIGALGTKTITFPQPITPVVLGATATLAATTSNGDPVTYSITAGTATLSGSSGITYTHAGLVTITANSAATSTYAAAAPVSVSVNVQPGTPLISWTPNPSTLAYGTALSAAQLDATASYNGVNVPGAFTYTPASGTVLNPGNQNLNVSFAPTDTADYTTATGTTSITVTSPGNGYTAPTTPVGTTSATQTANVQFNLNGTIAAINVLTHGASNLDYKLVSGGTCAVGTAYTAGQVCSVEYTFTPSVPGTRLGGITLTMTSSAGVVLGNSYLTGIGTGPQVIFPGNNLPTTLNSNFTLAQGVAEDGDGNLFIADTLGGAVKELLASSGYTTVNNIGSGLGGPSALAMDGLGNLFVAAIEGGGSLPGEVFEVTAASGYTSVTSIGSAFTTPGGIAVDGTGDLYVADSGANRITKYTASSGYSAATILGSGFSGPFGIAVDGAKNVFVADQNNNAVKEITAASNYATVNTLGSGLNGPRSVAVDASGNVFVGDFGDSSIKEILAVGGYTSVVTLQNFQAAGIIVDPSGNLVSVNGQFVVKLNYATPPSLTFPATNVGSTSAAQSVTLANDGNAALLFTGLASTNASNFPLTGSSCTATGSLAAGTSCTVGVEFTPQTTGTLTGNANATDNTLNVPGSVQSIALSGASGLNTKTITFPQPTTPVALNATATLAATASNGDPVTYSITGGAASIVGSQITYSNAGTITIAANSAATSTYAAAPQVTRQVVVQQATPTVTWSTPGAIVYGTALSATQLDATASVPGTFVYTPAAGTVVGVGTPTLSVLFTPTDSADYTTVTKTVSLLVTKAAPVVTWPSPASIVAGTPLSATQLDATATGPNGETVSGTFTYTPPAGTVLGLGLQTLQVAFAPTDAADYNSATGSTTINVVAPSGSMAPATPVGSTSATQTAALTFTTSGTLGSINVLTQGAANLDYKLVSGGTCAAGTAYTSGQSCTVLYTFTPSFPGSRLGGITLANASGALLADGYLAGIGTGPQVTFPSNSLPSTLAGGFTAALAVAQDGSGNLFVTDAGTGTLSELLASTNYATSNPIANGFVAPYGIALDGFGNLFVADAGKSAVEFLSAASGYQSVTSVGSGFEQPGGVAVDGAGDLYVSDFGTQTVFKFTAASGYTQSTTLGSGFGVPAGIAVDLNGNVFVADSQANAVKEITAASGYTTVNTLGGDSSTLTNPRAVAVDAAGNVFVTDVDDFTIREIPAVGGYTTVNTLATSTAVPALAGEQGMLIDGSGNLIVSAGTTVLKLDYSTAPALAFPATVVGSASPVQNVTVANDGNTTLTFGGLALSNANFTFNGSTCTATGTLAAGTSCSIGLEFTPLTYASLTGSATVTDNTRNAAGTVQTLALSGTGVAEAKTISFPQPTSPAARNASATLAATTSNGDPVTYSILSGTATLSGSTITYTTAGTVVIAADSAATSTYAAAPEVTRTVQVLQSGSTVTWTPNPATITYGTALSAAQLDATATIPGAFVYTPAAGTILGAGAQTLSVVFTPTDTTNYSVVTQTAGIIVTKATPTVTWTNPAGIVQGTALSATQLNATASVPGTFVYTPAAGTVLGAGTQTLSVLFTPTDAADYNTVAQTVSLVVTKATPTVTWTTPAPIGYGTALSSTQLDATASVPGAFVYTPAAGTVPLPGTQTLSVLFTPTDTTDYNTVTQTVSLVVNIPTTTAVLTSSANPSQFGQPITLSLAIKPSATLAAAPTGTVTFKDGATTLGTANLANNLATLPISTLLAGSHALTAVYSGDTNYVGSTSPILTQVVNPATTNIAWTPSVASIVYGTALSGAQLNATVSTAYATTVAGVFTYTPASGSVLTAGTQTLHVTFTPTDTADFQTATGTATVNVTQATPVLTWPTPAGLVVGTPLSSTQLDAAAAGVTGAALPGAFVYTPPAGTLVTGGAQTLSVVFTPTDTTDYTTASASVMLNGTPLALTALSSTTALLGDPAKTITLTGAGFLPTSVVQVAGSAVATTYVSPTSLTAVIPASNFLVVATLPVTVSDPAQNAVSSAINISVTAPPVSITFSSPGTVQPAQQPTVPLALVNPYPVTLTGVVTLTFTPQGTGPNDPSIQFAQGGRTLTFQVPPGTTQTPTIQFQTGTVAGTITLTLTLTAGGVNVTPATIQPISVPLPQVVPAITAVSFVQSGSSVLVSVTGYSNTLQVATANFHFTAASGSALANPDISIPVSTLFAPYYSSTASAPYGSEFVYTQFFTLSESETIGSVSVTLVNSVGTSASTASQ